MIKLEGSVGRNGENRPKDVLNVIRLMGRNQHLLAPYEDPAPHGCCDDKLVGLIERFERRVTLQPRPDGRIDPGGIALKALNENARDADGEHREALLMPLESGGIGVYLDPPHAFGSRRRAGWRHPGADLPAEPGTAVLAMADGRVLRDPYPFWLGTQALEIEHDGLIARYCEIEQVAVGLLAGSTVQRGQVIAYVGRLEGIEDSMLHLELYSGRRLGELTAHENRPFGRRADLLDPTDFLSSAVLAGRERPLSPSRSKRAIAT